MGQTLCVYYSVESGKTIKRSARALVLKGKCRWPDTSSQSVLITTDDAQKDTEDCLIKFVVAMGSVGFSTLGEATVNLESYINSETPVSVSCPLQKCNHKTILQVQIQCLTPTTGSRDEASRDTNLIMEEMNVDYDDLENRSDVSDSAIIRSAGSSSSRLLEVSHQSGEFYIKEKSFSDLASNLILEASVSASASGSSFGSREGSFGREDLPRKGNLSGVLKDSPGRQNLSGTQDSDSGHYSFNEYSRSNHSSCGPKVATSGSQSQNHGEEPDQASMVGISTSQNSGPSNDLLDSADVTIVLLQAEVNMWKQNSQRLMAELDKLQHELLEETKHRTTLQVELSDLQTQCDGLQQELDKLRMLMKEPEGKQEAQEKIAFQIEDKDDIKKEWEKEMKFLKELNANLALQLKKSQEANIELVFVLQEMENTMEKQQMEINNLPMDKVEIEDMDTYSISSEDNKRMDSADQDFPEVIRKKLHGSCTEETIVQSHEFKTGDIKNLKFQLQSEKKPEETLPIFGEALEKKTHELETEGVAGCGAERVRKVVESESETTNLDAKFYENLDAQGQEELCFENGDHCSLFKETEVLRKKLLVLENEHRELTEENVALRSKLKKSAKEILTCENSASSFPAESTEKVVSYKPEFDISKPITNQRLRKEILITENVDNKMKNQRINLEEQCPDMDSKSQMFVDKAFDIDDEHFKERQEMNIASLHQSEPHRRHEADCKDNLAAIHTELKVADLNVAIKMSELFSRFYECFQLSETNERNGIDKPSPVTSLDNKRDFTWLEGFENEDFHVVEQAEFICNKFIQLKNFFEANFTRCGDEIKRLGEKLRSRVAGTGEVESLHAEFGFDNHNLEKNFVLDCLRYENMMKDKEIEDLRHCKSELEAQIVSLEKEKSRMEANVTDSLGDVSTDPQVVVSKNISRKSLELKSEKDELEVHLLELENENICLSERISGLEAVLRYLTDEKESTCLLLRDSQSHVRELQNKVREFENEIKAQKLVFKEKLQDKQEQCFEALEESQNLKIENEKLQATIESIMEECSLLQISNSELRKRKLDLQEHCTILEAELKGTLELFSRILKEVEILEEKFCRILKEISLKEKSMNGELDALVREIKKHNANLARDDSLLNQMYLEKTAEVDNLKRKVVHLMEQISATFDEKEIEASEVILELCCLREDKAMLEAAQQEAQGKLKLCESKIDLIQNESEKRVLGVISELAVSKQKQEILMDCHRKVLSSLEDVKYSESKLKNMLLRQEYKSKASESDRQNLAEEVSGLKMKLQKMEQLQDEVLALKKSLFAAETQNKYLKASLETLAEDYEELKAKRVTYLERIFDMQKVASDLGDYRRSKAALEEKVWRLEWDLTAKEATCTLQSKMKNELARLTRTNTQFKKKIKCLEQEKEECLKRVQELEEELKQDKEENQNHEASNNGKLSDDPEFYATCGSTRDHTWCSKDDAKQIQRFSGNPQIKGLDPSLDNRVS